MPRWRLNKNGRTRRGGRWEVSSRPLGGSPRPYWIVRCIIAARGNGRPAIINNPRRTAFRRRGYVVVRAKRIADGGTWRTRMKRGGSIPRSQSNRYNRKGHEANGVTDGTTDGVHKPFRPPSKGLVLLRFVAGWQSPAPSASQPDFEGRRIAAALERLFAAGLRPLGTAVNANPPRAAARMTWREADVLEAVGNGSVVPRDDRESP